MLSSRSLLRLGIRAGLGLLTGGILVVGSQAVAGAQSPNEAVPCEVAMVIGCVATITGPQGDVSMTLRVSDVGSEQTESSTSSGAASEADEAGESQDPNADASESGTEGESAGDSDGFNPLTQAFDLFQSDQSDRPLQTTVDPWEQGGLQSNFGTDSIPISHYQIGADVDGWLGVPDPLDSFVASQTNWAFTTTTFLVLLATNALDWAFEFPLGESLVGDAGVLAQNYTLDFFGFGLSTSVYGLALSVTMVVAGFKAITKGLVAAGSEVIVAFAAYVVLIVLTVSSGFGNAGLTISRISSDLSGSIATFAAGAERQEACALELRASRNPSSLAGASADADGSSTSAGSSACSFGYAIQRSMVELPYQNLQWGQVLDGVGGKERCAAINLELLSEGPWGNDDEPRDRMRSASECEENADFNHQATYIRLGIASANALTTGAVTVLILVVAAMLLWQQIKLLFLTVTMPHALVMAILPGRSRHLAWRWIELFVGVVIRTVILSLGLVVWLSLFSLIVYEQLTFRGIFLSLFASVSMAVSGFWGLYKLSGLTRRRSPEAPAPTKAVTATTEGGNGGGSGPESRRRSTSEENRQPGGRLAQGARSTVRAVRGRSAAGATGGPTAGRPTKSGGGKAGALSGAIGTSTGSTSGQAGATGKPAGPTSPRPMAGPANRTGQTSGETGASTRSPLINRPQRLAKFSGGPGDRPGGGAAAPRPKTRPVGTSKPTEIGAGRP